MVKHFLPVLFLLVLFSRLMQAQSGPEQQKPDPEKIFSELLTPYQKLNDYSVTIHTNVKMEGIRVPDFTVTLFFKKPDQFHLETKKFALLPRNSAVFNPLQFSLNKNRITYERSETIQEIKADVFKVEPLAEDAQVRFFYVWIGGNPRNILQFESHPFKGSTISAKISYQAVSGPEETFWLPERINVHLTFPAPSQRPTFLPGKDTPLAMGMMMMEDLPNEGDIFISYSRWQVNTGLDDKIFQKDKKQDH